VTRNRTPIEDYPVRDAVRAGIAYTLEFEEVEACVAAGLDLDRWMNGGYSVRLMEKTVGWYRVHNLVALHQQDAVNEKQRRASRGRRRGYRGRR
jgi:hypothetical protein